MNRYRVRQKLQAALDKIREAAHDETVSRFEQLSREAAFTALVDVATEAGIITMGEAKKWLECGDYNPEVEQMSPLEAQKGAKAWMAA